MNKLMRSVTASLAVFTPLAIAPTAQATQVERSHPSTYVVGGEKADAPAIVQLEFGQKGGTYGCTGELISDDWILTAQHCTHGDSWMNVYTSNDTVHRGPAHAVDRMANSPSGDVALVHLAKPMGGAQTVSLSDSYSPTSGDAGTIFGYGLRANKQRPDHLYKARVNVLGRSTDAYGGNAIHVRGNTGASNHGDSGGPLFVDGQLVGVCSTGDSADPGANTHAGSNYANVSDSRGWIEETTGV